MTQSPDQAAEKAEITHSTTSNTSTTRKRRRRAPASGAAADCFTCQERAFKCDRRRPYCTPCLDLGRDCSGYKTTLTWGVGVASRGKLRGLSLPITNSKRAAPADEDEADKPLSPPKKLAKLGSSRGGPASSRREQDTRKPAVGDSTILSPNSTSYGFVNSHPPAPPSTTISSTSETQWRRPHSLSHTRGLRMSDKKPRRHTLQPIHVSSRHPARDYGIMPMTASIVGGYGHQSFDFSLQTSPAVPSFAGYDIQTSQVRDYMPPTSAPYDTTMFNSSHLPWASQPMTPDLGSEHDSPPTTQTDVPAYFGGAEDLLSLHGIPDSRTPSITTISDAATFTTQADFQVLNASGASLVTDDVGAHSSFQIPQMPSLQIGRTAELQFLIDYYDKVISPVIVAFDSPTNPYRAHILQLAVGSEPLQHAIATLAACNLRIRRTQNQEPAVLPIADGTGSSHELAVQQAHLAHNMLTTDFENMQHTSADDTMAQELYHRSLGIQGLNEQLSDHKHRNDDAVIASLLILCLYHICDTGIAKFKTQAAGVKKLLALRNKKGSSRSHAGNWLTIMFTWFDSLSASVNDRPSELSPDAFDDDQSYGNEWSLENLAGCDTRLFKTISKLGRLNMLRQSRSSSLPPEGLVSPPMSSSSTTNDYYSMRNPDFSPPPQTPSYSDIRSTAHTKSSSSTPSSDFWQEWSMIKSSLQSWAMPPNTPPLSGRANPSNQQDLLHISESFRYSALLYVERLAFPSLPSSHPTLQVLVSQALHHIMRVKSDVFLLWPLFITGTEIVAEGARQMVREKVWQLQRDSGFFNNLSCLQVLEKVWRDGPIEDADGFEMGGRRRSEQLSLMQGMGNGVTGLSPGEYSGNGFRWRKAMERTDGEYIVV